MNFHFERLRRSPIIDHSGTTSNLMRFYGLFHTLEDEKQGLHYHWVDMLFFCVLIVIYRKRFDTFDEFVAQTPGAVQGLPAEVDGSVLNQLNYETRTT